MLSTVQAPRMKATATILACAAASIVGTAPASADIDPHGGMMRFPDVSDSHVVFAYANDLWIVPREGGTALPLASPPGPELLPRFSPDGETIAFVGNYDGVRDIYTVSQRGGVPQRVTHHPGQPMLSEWTPDGRLLFSMSGLGGLTRQTQLFTVDAEGGLPEQLPVPYGAFGSISDDGRWLAYVPHSREFRTWKRYQGGMATDIWLFDLEDHNSEKITDWLGTDSLPMWHDGRVYYLSDQGETHRLNLWMYDPETGDREQLTEHEAYDVKWPSIGPGEDGAGEIIYQAGSNLRLLNLATGEGTDLDVTIPGDRPTIRENTVDAQETIAAWNISSTGKRAVTEARGDIWTLPAEHGSPRNLHRTSGTAERDPAWSPDGRWICYFSDETGEYELYVTQSDGRGETKQLTDDSQTYYMDPHWSPDSEHVAYFDKAGHLFLTTVESGETRRVDTDPWAWDQSARNLSWSHDSAWLAYQRSGDDNPNTSIWIYDVENDVTRQVTSDMFSDGAPAFDREGDWLYFTSTRSFSPQYSDIDTTFIYSDVYTLLAVPLRDDIDSPFLPESDEEEWSDDEEAKDEDESDEPAEEDEQSDEPAEDDDQSEEQAGDETEDAGDEAADEEEDEAEEEEAIEIHFDGFERRAIQLPVESGNFSHLNVNHQNALLYVRSGGRGSGESSRVMLFNMHGDDEEEHLVADNAGSFVMSGDGQKILIPRGNSAAIQDAAAGAQGKPVVTAGMTVSISPREEWAQIFHDAWRRHRDYFYDPDMHGVDWPAVREQYEAMLDDCISREDVSYVIGEMIAELNVGHAYYWGGDHEDQPRTNVGMLGVDWAVDNGAYRIERIHEGGPWDADARGPLSQPGVEVNEGDYVLEVDGVTMDPSRDPWSYFQGTAGRVVRLTVNDAPEINDDARTVNVEPLAGESELRYRSWVESKRQYVAEQTDGRVGYIYVPNTGVQGQNELFRQFYGQQEADALIIDERWNGGGQIPTRFIELLNRPTTNYWARRDGRDWRWPPDSHQGPKCMLINGLAGSGGDAFPYYFRQAGLGKLIGMRTWGGLVGITGVPGLIDGGYTAVPTFAFYETDGTWGIEGWGVDPDIEVVDDPALMVDGDDPQLDAAIEHMLDALEDNPPQRPDRPEAPDRSGMGIDPAHR